VAEVAQRLGITSHSLYAWKKTFAKPEAVQRAELDQSAEVRRLKAELKRMTEERDILKKAAAYFAKG
jgi:transposase